MRGRAQYLIYFNGVRDRYSHKVSEIVDLDSVSPVGVDRLLVSTRRADIVRIGYRPTPAAAREFVSREL